MCKIIYYIIYNKQCLSHIEKNPIKFVTKNIKIKNEKNLTI